MRHLREAIVRCVWLAGLLMIACVSLGSLWLGLDSLGDQAGAKFCQGVFWGVLACWVLNGITLMGLLTASVLSHNSVGKESQSLEDG